MVKIKFGFSHLAWNQTLFSVVNWIDRTSFLKAIY